MRDLVALPKAHLHVHLESSVRWGTLREIGAANGVAVPDDVGVFGDFAAFFAQNDLVRACLRRPGDFRRIAYEYRLLGHHPTWASGGPDQRRR